MRTATKKPFGDFWFVKHAERPTGKQIVLYRALTPYSEGRPGVSTHAMKGTVMSGHFAVFNTPTVITERSGRYIEKIAPGAFTKTFKEGRIKVLLQHGQDPTVGQKPIGKVLSLEEDHIGAKYQVELFTDAAYVRELLPALRAGAFGASFRFRPVKEDWVQKPPKTAQNPEGYPIRTIREAAVAEFGPVTFGAYPTASAGVRCVDMAPILAEQQAEREKRTKMSGLFWLAEPPRSLQQRQLQGAS
jgi:HK97 family phage prohead protease